MIAWLAIAAGAVVLLAVTSVSSKQLERGKRYVARYLPPEGLAMSESLATNLRSILPPSSILTLNADGSFEVIFASVSDKAIGDIQTPLGVFKLESVREVSA